MSQGDIEYVTQRRDQVEKEFHSLVPLKKTPQVFLQRQQLKGRLTTLNRWIKELTQLEKQKL
ncbi:MAG: hypothetical protein AB9842_08180 [Bacteroidales bacterium]